MIALAASWALLGATVVSAQEETAGLPTIVVTTEVLGSVVSDLVGDDAVVEVLMNGGADPHSWQPSARDAASIVTADLVVANGLGLEEALVDILEEAEDQGGLVFTATDHIVDPIPSDDRPVDPHFWLDPVAMQSVASRLAMSLADVGIDATERAASVTAALESLHTEITTELASIPAEQRRLVTGHDALAYYADRYGFEVIGTVIPGVSTSGEASARDLAELIGAIKAEGATTIFTDVGTPQSVAASIASDAGASVVELEVTAIPPGGDYAELLRSITSAIVGAVGPTP
jgi:zinc/manganese transport system substrate-binding protein